MTNIKDLIIRSTICHMMGCTDPHHDSDMTKRLSDKGFLIDCTTSYRVLDDDGKEDAIMTIIIPFSEYTKLITHASLLGEYLSRPFIAPFKDKPIAVIVLMDNCMINAFKKAIDEIKPWSDKDTKSLTNQLLSANSTINELRLEAKRRNTDTTSLTNQLLSANDVIKELRLELKGLRLSDKKKKKRERLMQPPAYIDADPPAF